MRGNESSMQPSRTQVDCGRIRWETLLRTHDKSNPVKLVVNGK